MRGSSFVLFCSQNASFFFLFVFFVRLFTLEGDKMHKRLTVRRNDEGIFMQEEKST